MMSATCRSRRISWTMPLAVLAWLVIAPASGAEEGVRLAQAANPCAAKNPCATKNPCNPCNPCAGKNPCNPCGGGAKLDATRFMQPADVRVTTSEALVAKGEALWNDASLGKTGLACGACHAGGYAQMNPTFAKPFPHRVAMPAVRSGVAQVNAAEMVNFCMLVPMNTEPLAWDSEELAALASYVEHLQPGYESFLAGSQSNPCSGNPCNPCGANPCNP